MTAVLLFWNTNVAAVTSCENALLFHSHVQGLSGTCSFYIFTSNASIHPGKLHYGKAALYVLIG